MFNIPSQILNNSSILDSRCILPTRSFSRIRPLPQHTPRRVFLPFLWVISFRRVVTRVKKAQRPPVSAGSASPNRPTPQDIAPSTYCGVVRMGEIGVGGAAGGGKRVEGSPLLEDRAGDVLSIARRCPSIISLSVSTSVRMDLEHLSGCMDRL